MKISADQYLLKQKNWPAELEVLREILLVHSLASRNIIAINPVFQMV